MTSPAPSSSPHPCGEAVDSTSGSESVELPADVARALLGSLRTVGADLNLDRVLRRTIETACEITNARYGAIGVLDVTGRELAAFVTHGMSDLQRRALGSPPRGHGVLGHLIAQPRTRRIDNIGEHAAAVGWPPGHPPMSTLLGTPIRVEERIYGIVYLTERKDGKPFSAQDERALTILAEAAGLAIRNAQKLARARSRARWADAVGELTRTLLEGKHESSALARMVKRSRELSAAACAFVALRTDSGELIVEGGDSSDPAARAKLRGALLSARTWQLVLRYRVAFTLMETPHDETTGDLIAHVHELTGMSEPITALVAPIVVGEEEIGLIVLVWPTREGSRAIETMDVLPEFAARMGVALEAGRAQRQRTRTSVLEDRDRIARDLHDHVIQRLFAAGLSLQVMGRRAGHDEQERIGGIVAELNETVRALREAITGLHRHLPEGGLGPEIERLVESAATACGFVPDLSLEGRLGNIPADVEFEVLAVIREGLSNMVRHSQAGDASVVVRVSDEVLVVIQDDGVGLADDAAPSGLANLAERARAQRGSLAVSRRHPRGTMLRWRIPLM